VPSEIQESIVNADARNLEYLAPHHGKFSFEIIAGLYISIFDGELLDRRLR
jgi:hypothetical protein